MQLRSNPNRAINFTAVLTCERKRPIKAPSSFFPAEQRRRRKMIAFPGERIYIIRENKSVADTAIKIGKAKKIERAGLAASDPHFHWPPSSFCARD
jgi:hypothetical protein